MASLVTASAEGTCLLADTPAKQGRATFGGNASVYVTDIERAITFYTDVLGLTLKMRVGTEWAEIDAGNGLIIGLHLARPPETVAAGTRGAINIELKAIGSLDVVVAGIRAKGGAFKGEILNYPAVRIATVLDPDQNEILIGQVLDTGEGASDSAS
ncbi:MAG: hypothetical protein JWN66_798 [Sphingomonas bacterium]|nr:hypothetical protein [Sphingomonas bacterium]